MATTDTKAMSDQSREQDSANSSWRTLLPGLLASVLVVAVAITLGFYVRNTLESLEEKLSYQSPAGDQTIGKGTYDIELAEGQTVYVPVYSHIYADGGKPFLLETTLSIRNLDPKRPITIKSVKYFDTEGAPVREYLNGEVRLSPLATAEFLIEKQDISGGSGANFIVVWDTDEVVYEPLIEAVMVGFADSRSISFTSQGRALVEPGE